MGWVLAFHLFAQTGQADSGQLRLTGLVPATLGASLFAQGDRLAFRNSGNEPAVFEIGDDSETLAPGEVRGFTLPAGSGEPIAIRVVAP